MAFIDDIDPTDPPFNGPAGQGDDQIRALKGDVKNSFPNVAGAVSATDVQLSYTINIPIDTNAELDLKADLAGPQTHTGTHTYSGTIAMGGSASITANGATIADNEVAFLDGVTSAIQTQINARALLNGSTGQRFDVAAPNANDQAIRRDTYGTQTTGGTAKMWVTGGDTFNVQLS